VLRSMSFILIGLAVGLVYGKLATVNHWLLPPNWLGRLAGADGESSYDWAYASLYVDTAILGLIAWGILRLVQASHQGR
jgi:hypothetical protein